MPGEDIILDYHANDRDVIEAFRRQQSELQKERQSRQQLEKEMRGAAARERTWNRERFNAMKKIGKEQERLADIARRAIEKTRTPYQRFESDLFDLQQALDAGKLSTSQFAAAKQNLVRRLRDERRELSGENKMLREAAQVVEQTRTATERYESALNRLNRLRKAGKLTADQHARAVQQEKTKLDSASSSTQALGKSLLSAAGQMTGFVGGIGSILKIVEQLRSEYDRLIERQREAGEVQFELAGAQSQAVKNLGSDKEIDARRLFAIISQKSLDTGIDELRLTRAVSDALSARGDRSARDAIEATVTAARFERFGDDQTLQTLAGSALDISKGTGLSHEASLGFLSQAGQLSRVTSTEELSRNIAPAIVNAMSGGVTKEFAGALVSTLTQGIVDESGRVSRNALTGMITQLEDFDPSRNVQDTFDLLQKDEGLRQRFLETSSFEKKAQFAIQDVLTPGTGQAKTFQNALQTLQNNSAQDQFDRVVQQQEQLPAIQVSIAKQKLQTLNRSLLAADEEGAIAGVVRDGMAELRKTLGRSGFMSAIEGTFEELESFAGGDSFTLQGARDLVFKERTALIEGYLASLEEVENGEVQLNPLDSKRFQALKLVEEQILSLADKVQQRRDFNAANPLVPLPVAQANPVVPPAAEASDEVPLSPDQLLRLNPLKGSAASLQLTPDQFAKKFPLLDKRFRQEQGLLSDLPFADTALSGLRSRDPLKLSQSVEALRVRQRELLTPDAVLVDGRLSDVPGTVTVREKKDAAAIEELIGRMDQLIELTEQSLHSDVDRQEQRVVQAANSAALKRPARQGLEGL